MHYVRCPRLQGPTTTDLDVATLLSSNTYVISRSSVRPLVPDSATLTLSAVGFVWATPSHPTPWNLPRALSCALTVSRHVKSRTFNSRTRSYATLVK